MPDKQMRRAKTPGPYPLRHILLLVSCESDLDRTPTGDKKKIGEKEEKASGDDPRCTVLQAIRFG
jgi:hypothetical protein